MSDIDIWTAVFNLVSPTPTTRPPSRPFYTPIPPIGYSSALQPGNEQTAVPWASLPLMCHIPSLALVHGHGSTCPGTRQQVLKANHSPEWTATACCNWPGSRRVKEKGCQYRQNRLGRDCPTAVRQGGGDASREVELTLSHGERVIGNNQRARE